MRASSLLLVSLLPAAFGAGPRAEQRLARQVQSSPSPANMLLARKTTSPVKVAVKTTSTSKKATSTLTKKTTTSVKKTTSIMKVSTTTKKITSTTSKPSTTAKASKASSSTLARSSAKATSSSVAKVSTTTTKATTTASKSFSSTSSSRSTKAAVPTSSSVSSIPVSTVRGVNLGGLFIVEPWMMQAEWARIGCAGQNSEFDCMANVSLSAVAQEGFISHWESWITQGDILNISSYGLNTIRIPVGYWIVEGLVNRTSEYFATGGFFYLKRVCGWAADAGLNVILDLHGAPGSQAINTAFSGQDTPHAGFFNSYNYHRAYQWLTNMTIEVHSNVEFRTVFALEAVNEPLQWQANFASNYYPGVVNAVRAAESSLNVSCSSSSSTSAVPSSVNKGCLSIQFMDTNWGAGSAQTALKSLPTTPQNVIYDGHDYDKWSSANSSRAGYLTYSCTSANFFTSSSTPSIVGEWSLGVSDTYVPELANNATDAAAFFYHWASAQMSVFEQARGWIFWTWKTDTLNNPQWDYQLAVGAGYLPSQAGSWNKTACVGY